MHVPVWTVVFPIALTALLTLVPLEALLMVRHWRAIPPQQRPYEIGELPEFRGFSAPTVAMCLFGVLAASLTAVLVWQMWARATRRCPHRTTVTSCGLRSFRHDDHRRAVRRPRPA